MSKPQWEPGDLVDVWDSDVRVWVAGVVEKLTKLPLRSEIFVVVQVDAPDPGLLAVNKVPGVYAVGDYGMLRRRRG